MPTPSQPGIHSYNSSSPPNRLVEFFLGTCVFLAPLVFLIGAAYLTFEAPSAIQWVVFFLLMLVTSTIEGGILDAWQSRKERIRAARNPQE